eukprot:scaffold5868_cov172-Pinguiococcus_pyrenoidosus.AAC.1
MVCFLHSLRLLLESRATEDAHTSYPSRTARKPSGSTVNQLDGYALENIPSMSATRLVSQSPRSCIKARATANIRFMFVTLLVSQAPRSRLKELACKHMPSILGTLLIAHVCDAGRIPTHVRCLGHWEPLPGWPTP